MWNRGCPTHKGVPLTPEAKPRVLKEPPSGGQPLFHIIKPSPSSIYFRTWPLPRRYFSRWINQDITLYSKCVRVTSHQGGGKGDLLALMDREFIDQWNLFMVFYGMAVGGHLHLVCSMWNFSLHPATGGEGSGTAKLNFNRLWLELSMTGLTD